MRQRQKMFSESSILPPVAFGARTNDLSSLQLLRTIEDTSRAECSETSPLTGGLLPR